jgi:hypothetical protein
VFVPPHPIAIGFPDELEALDQHLGVIDSAEVDSEDFWENFFPNWRGDEVREPATDWTEQEAESVFHRLCAHGIGQSEQITAEMDRPKEDVSALVDSILLFLLGDPSGPDPPALFGSLVFFSFFGRPSARGFDNTRSFWQSYFEKHPLAESPVYEGGTFCDFLRANRTTCIAALETNWILRAFLSIRTEPYLPPRCMVRSDEALAARRLVYGLFQNVLQFGTDWPEVARHLPLSIPSNLLPGLFEHVVPAITVDIFSYVLHHTVPKDGVLAPIAALFESGPWSTTWTEADVKAIINVLGEFGLPLQETSKPDWAEFHALTQLTEKSTEMVTALTTELLSRFQSLHKVTLECGLSFDAEYVSTTYPKIQFCAKVRSVLKEGLPSFRPLLGVPNWTAHCDRLLLQGVVQFGVDHLESVVLGDALGLQHEHFDTVMEKSLFGFASQLTPELAVSRVREILALSSNRR